MGDTRDREEAAASELLARHWGWLLGLGLLLVIAGAVAIGAQFIATLATVWFLGILAAVAGIVEVAAGFSGRSWGGFAVHLVIGGLLIAIGVVLLFAPGIGAGALTLLFAGLFFIGGLARLVDAVIRRYEGWGWSLFGGAVAVFLGALLLAQWPASSLWFLGLYLGVDLIFIGVSWITLAASAHNAWRGGALEIPGHEAPGPA